MKAVCERLGYIGARVRAGGAGWRDGGSAGPPGRAHPEGAHEADDADGEADLREGDEGRGDDDEVEDAPAVVGESAEPVGEGVDRELDGEGDGEEDVEAAQGGGDAGVVQPAGLQLRGPEELRLDHADDEVLPWGHRPFHYGSVGQRGQLDCTTKRAYREELKVGVGSGSVLS